MDINDFKGCFGDWDTLWLDTILYKYNIVIDFVVREEDIYRSLYRIIGWTKIPQDILLHVINMSNYADEELAVKASGIQFIRLSDINKISIYPGDQDFD